MAVITFPTTRFGNVEVDEALLVCFPAGLVGFEHLRRFVILEGPAGTPLKWLQSVDEPAIAFVVADPVAIIPDYVVRVRGEDLNPLNLDSPEDATVAVIITVPGELPKATCNLLAPLIFNVEKRLGMQVVLDEDYPIRHPLAVCAAGDENRAEGD
ncbi:MAG TPA: flagellar assembly protein FliW [Planctomycetes bacterium]|nr:flagellar assembly protein FliW [Planctomycetota bacterium]